MEAKLIPLDSKQPSLEANLIIEPWSYHSIFGTGSDHGYNFCMYMPKQGLAVYIRSRHQMKGADPHGEWKPIDPQDHFYNEEKKDIWERSTLSVYKTLDEQLTYLKSLDEPATLGPVAIISKNLNSDSTSSKRKIFFSPVIKSISISWADLGLFFKPFRRREDSAPLFDLLYSYVDGK